MVSQWQESLICVIEKVRLFWSEEKAADYCRTAPLVELWLFLDFHHGRHSSRETRWWRRIVAAPTGGAPRPVHPQFCQCFLLALVPTAVALGRRGTGTTGHAVFKLLAGELHFIKGTRERARDTDTARNCVRER